MIGSRRATQKGDFSWLAWAEDYLTEDIGQAPNFGLPLDESGGSTARDIIGGHDGTYNGSPEYGARSLVDDDKGSVDLSGGSTYVQVPNSSDLVPGTGSYTYIVWWEWGGEHPNVEQLLYFTGGENVQLFESSSRMYARAWDDTTVSSVGDAQAVQFGPAPRGIMHAMVVDGANDEIRLNVNGKSTTKAPPGGDLGDVSPGFDMYIGSNSFDGASVSGRVGPVLGVPGALSDATLKRLYSVGRDRHRTLDARHNIWSARRSQVPTLDEVFLLAGQSNSVGLAEYDQYNTDHLHPSYGYTEDDRTWRPLDSDAGTTVFRESIWPMVAEKLGLHESKSTGWIQTSEGSTSITEWQPGASAGYYSRMLSTYDDADEDARAMLWYQGEADVSGGMSTSDYESYLNALVDSLHADRGIKTVVGVVHNWDDVSDANHQAIVDAQKNVIANNPNALQGPDQSGLELPGIHYVSNDEIANFATAWWEALERLFYGGVT